MITEPPRVRLRSRQPEGIHKAVQLPVLTVIREGRILGLPQRQFCWEAAPINVSFPGDFVFILCAKTGACRTVVHEELRALCVFEGIDIDQLVSIPYGAPQDSDESITGLWVGNVLVRLRVKSGEDRDNLRSAAIRVVRRSVYVRSVMELAAMGKDAACSFENGKNDFRLLSDAMDEISERRQTFKFLYDTVNVVNSSRIEQQTEMLITYKDCFPQRSPVNLNWPDQVFVALEIHTPAHTESRGYPTGATHPLLGRSERREPNELALEITPCRFITGRLLADTALAVNMGGWPAAFALSHRPILGPTTLEHKLAFAMANMADVTGNSFVLDPFVGTGSLALACSAIGATVAGSDFDMRVIRGYSVARLNRRWVNRKRASKNEKGISQTDKTQRSDIFTNFEAYQLCRPDIWRMDVFHPAMRSVPIFDAIVTDPPYGIRATSRAVDELTSEVIPKSSIHGYEEVYGQLFKLAGKYLKTGGKLVFLLPTPLMGKREEDLHKVEGMAWELGNLKLVGCCFQSLQKNALGRLLLTMKKEVKL